jgi:hypothetical protein
MNIKKKLKIKLYLEKGVDPSVYDEREVDNLDEFMSFIDEDLEGEVEVDEEQTV